LHGHLETVAAGDSMPPACGYARRHIADLVRGSLSRRRRRRVEAHLGECESCCDARRELERINHHLRTAPVLPVCAGAVLLRRGLKDRLIGLLGASGAPVVAVTSLVVVSGVVPFIVAHRASGEDRVATAAAPASSDVENTTASTRAPSRVLPADDSPTATPPRSPVRRAAAPEGRREREPTRPIRPRAPRTPVKRGRTGEQVPRRPEPTDTTPAPGATPPDAESPTVTVLPPISVPDVSTPAVSLPPVSTPVVTVPSVTVPSVTVPAITVPTVTAPPTTLPPVTLPPTTDPATTVPSVTVPPITLPSIGD
jgi:Putative zinc-finger